MPPGRTQSQLLEEANSNRTLAYCGGTPLSLSFDGSGAFLSVFGELLSPLNAPTILPNRLFFFFASSSVWTPVAACGFPSLPGGGRAFSEFPPNTREKKPGKIGRAHVCTPVT